MANQNEKKNYFERQFPNSDVAIMTIRTTQKAKKRFDDIRHYYGYTQGEFMVRLMEFAMDEAIRSGYKPQTEDA